MIRADDIAFHRKVFVRQIRRGLPLRAAYNANCIAAFSESDARPGAPWRHVERHLIDHNYDAAASTLDGLGCDIEAAAVREMALQRALAPA